MAKTLPDSYNSMGLPMNIIRSNPIPLDSTEIFDSLASAQTYATSNATAYVGQTIKVVDTTTSPIAVTQYIITDEAGTLATIADTDTIDEAIAAIEAIPDSDIIALFS